MKPSRSYCIENCLSVLICIVLFTNTIFAQFTFEQKQEIDSLNLIITEAEHDTSVAKASLQLSEILYVSNLDTFKELAKISATIAENNLAQNPTGKIKRSFQAILAGSYNNIGYYYKRKNDFDKALEFYYKAISLWEELGDKKGLASCLNNVGSLNEMQGNIPQALDLYERSLRLREEIDDYIGKSYSFNNLGYLYNRLGDIPKALDYYQKALKIKEKHGNKQSLALAINNIAYVYEGQGDYEKALEYYSKALKIREGLDDKIGIAGSFSNIASIYYNKGESGIALDYYYRSLRISEDIDDIVGASSSYRIISQVFRDKKDFKEALKYGEKSLKIIEQTKIQIGLAHSLNNLAEIYLETGNLTVAHNFAIKALETGQRLGFPDVIRDAALVLYRTSGKRKEASSALYYYELYIDMRDSIRNEETEKATIRQQANYELEKKEQEIVLLSSRSKVQELKLNRNRILIVSFLTGFVLVLILAIAIFRGYKKKQVINGILEKQNQEKTAMMKEIHHRVKNNLQVVNSLLKLQSYEVEDERVVTMFEECQNRVLSMALLHEKMYRSDDLKHIDVYEHFTLLVKDLVGNYAVGKDIELDIHVEDIDIGIKTLVPLGLIINEIITNSLKYAFKEKDKGKIKVHLKQLEGIKHEMIIGDDGVGMDKDFKVEESSSLGTELIQIFTEQLEGTMERLDSPGTQFRFVFENIDKE